MKTLEEQIISLATEKNITLSTAESCTGGLIASALTDVPGSSKVFLGGIISYASDVKVSHLGVNLSTINELGVVSAEVSTQMAQGVRKELKSDISVSTTGLAGPGGDDYGNPEGRVFIGISTPTKTISYKKDLKGTRLELKNSFKNEALQILLEELSSL